MKSSSIPIALLPLITPPFISKLLPESIQTPPADLDAFIHVLLRMVPPSIVKLLLEEINTPPAHKLERERSVP